MPPWPDDARSGEFLKWAIGLTLTVFVLVPALIRPASLEGIEKQLFGFRLEWFGSRAPAEDVAIVASDGDTATPMPSRPAAVTTRRTEATASQATPEFTAPPESVED